MIFLLHIYRILFAVLSFDIQESFSPVRGPERTVRIFAAVEKDMEQQ